MLNGWLLNGRVSGNDQTTRRGRKRPGRGMWPEELYDKLSFHLMSTFHRSFSVHILLQRSLGTLAVRERPLGPLGLLPSSQTFWLLYGLSGFRILPLAVSSLACGIFSVSSARHSAKAMIEKVRNAHLIALVYPIDYWIHLGCKTRIT
jgi:hypothetical protein